MPDTTDRLRPRGIRLPAVVSCLAAVGLLFATAPALVHAQGGDVQEGSEVLDAVNEGQRDCAELSDADFEAVGEFVMERMLGSARAHEGMDQMMDSTMGRGGLDQMHRFMGQRLSGCGGGSVPGGFGGMMGMMGMMGGGFGPGSEDDSGGPGSHGPGMMGGQPTADDDEDDDWGVALSMGLMVLALIGVLAYWLFSGRGGAAGSGGGAMSILDRRFAAGEIERDEYERRRTALGGP